MSNYETTTIQIDSKEYEKLLQKVKQFEFEHELVDVFESERDVAIARANFCILENKSFRKRIKNLEDTLSLLKGVLGLKLNDSNCLLDTSIKKDSNSNHSINLTKEGYDLIKKTLDKKTFDGNASDNITLKSKQFLETIANSKGVNPFTNSIEPNWKLFSEAIRAIYEDLELLEKFLKK